MSLQRYGVQGEPTSLVITLVGMPDTSRIMDAGIYQVTELPKHGAKGRVIPVSVSFNPVADVVTLVLAKRLPLNREAVLTVQGAGISLVQRFGLDAFAGSAAAARNQSFYNRAGRGIYGGLHLNSGQALNAASLHARRQAARG